VVYQFSCGVFALSDGIHGIHFEAIIQDAELNSDTLVILSDISKSLTSKTFLLTYPRILFYKRKYD